MENTRSQGRIKFRSFRLKVLRLVKFLMLKSSLLHSDKAEGKNEFFKYCLTFIGGCYS